MILIFIVVTIAIMFAGFLIVSDGHPSGFILAGLALIAIFALLLVNDYQTNKEYDRLISQCIESGYKEWECEAKLRHIKSGKS